ncbi:hypothetical protein ACFL59_12615 [Planctomycetota bacterium]
MLRAAAHDFESRHDGDAAAALRAEADRLENCDSACDSPFCALCSPPYSRSERRKTRNDLRGDALDLYDRAERASARMGGDKVFLSHRVFTMPPVPIQMVPCTSRIMRRAMTRLRRRKMIAVRLNWKYNQDQKAHRAFCNFYDRRGRKRCGAPISNPFAGKRCPECRTKIDRVKYGDVTLGGQLTMEFEAEEGSLVRCHIHELALGPYLDQFAVGASWHQVVADVAQKEGGDLRALRDSTHSVVTIDPVRTLPGMCDHLSKGHVSPDICADPEALAACVLAHNGCRWREPWGCFRRSKKTAKGRGDSATSTATGTDLAGAAPLTTTSPVSSPAAASPEPASPFANSAPTPITPMPCEDPCIPEDDPARWSMLSPPSRPERLRTDAVTHILLLPPSRETSEISEPYHPVWCSEWLLGEPTYFGRFEARRDDPPDPIGAELRAARAGEAPAPAELEKPKKRDLVRVLIVGQQAIVGGRVMKLVSGKPRLAVIDLNERDAGQLRNQLGGRPWHGFPNMTVASIGATGRGRSYRSRVTIHGQPPAWTLKLLPRTRDEYEVLLSNFIDLTEEYPADDFYAVDREVKRLRYLIDEQRAATLDHDVDVVEVGGMSVPKLSQLELDRVGRDLERPITQPEGMNWNEQIEEEIAAEAAREASAPEAWGAPREDGLSTGTRAGAAAPHVALRALSATSSPEACRGRR